MAKLSKVSCVPEGRTLYRGIGGMRLPQQFWQEDEAGVRGGVERGVLSLTTDIAVAINYVAGRKLATIFEIAVGAVNKGAAISHLSQWPEEEEVIMPPGSFLEVAGPLKVVWLDDGTPVLACPLQISCNLHTPTIEQIRCSRKNDLVSSVKHTILEIHRDLTALEDDEDIKQRASNDVTCRGPVEGGSFHSHSMIINPTPAPSLHNTGMVPAILRQCSEWADVALKSRDAEWFNDDHCYRRAIHEACELKRLALGQVEAWLEDSRLYGAWVRDWTMDRADRHVSGERWRMLEETKEEIKLAAGNSLEDACQVSSFLPYVLRPAKH